MKLNPLFPRESTLGLSTDLYELTMAAAYHATGRAQQKTTFELFTRRLPPRRNFLIAAGLEQALHYLQHVGFDGAAIDFLRNESVFRAVDKTFFEYLREFRFSGDAWALPEGSLVFADEPIFQVTAPVIEAQLVETYLISTFNVQTMIASKASRVCLAADNRSVIDFGSRRAHGPQAGLLAARAAYIGGCDGTSNVLAGSELGVPIFGTMAHSFIQFFDQEIDAFRHFQKTFPSHTVLLVDTYNTLEAVRRVSKLDVDVQGIRLDSGDLGELACEARRILDASGKTECQIFVSGDLNEDKLLCFALKDFPIDGYGVGTDMVVSSDSPSCDLVYKMVEVIREGRRSQPKFKAGERKETLPHRKQIHRRVQDGEFKGDLLTRWDEVPPAGLSESEPLLVQCLSDGDLCIHLPDIKKAREHALSQLKQLPSAYKDLQSSASYPVSISQELTLAQEELRRRYAGD